VAHVDRQQALPDAGGLDKRVHIARKFMQSLPARVDL
jgi:hypothetical protein